MKAINIFEYTTIDQLTFNIRILELPCLYIKAASFTLIIDIEEVLVLLLDLLWVQLLHVEDLLGLLQGNAQPATPREFNQWRTIFPTGDVRL